LYRKCLSFHDLTILPRPQNVRAAAAQGAKKTFLAPFSYDPEAHDPNQISDARRGTRPLVFVGSWMPERGPFMVRLLQEGLPLQIFGDHWHKAPEKSSLRQAWQGAAVYGTGYVRLILESEVAVGMLSKGNEDDHTQRSLEIPFIGGAAFCAQRTARHLEMFREGQEALFWDSPVECAAQIRRLLENTAERAAMVRKARARVVELKVSNDEVLVQALARLKQ